MVGYFSSEPAAPATGQSAAKFSTSRCTKALRDIAANPADTVKARANYAQSVQVTSAAGRELLQKRAEAAQRAQNGATPRAKAASPGRSSH